VKNGKEQQRLNNSYWQLIENVIEESIPASSTKMRKSEFQIVLPAFLRAVLVIERQKYISTTDLYRELRSYFHGGHVEDKLRIILREANQYCISKS